MADPGTALGATSIAVEVFKIVKSVARLVIEVQHYQSECIELRDDCIIILELLQAKKTVSVDTKLQNRIKTALTQCLAFVSNCVQEWGVMQRTLEVVFKRRHVTIRRELHWCTQLLTTDTMQSLLSDQTILMEGSGKHHLAVMGRFDMMDKRLTTELQSMRRDVQTAKSGLTLEHVSISKVVDVIRLEDPRLQLPRGWNVCAGCEAVLDGEEDVELIPLVSEDSVAGLQLPRMIRIYSKMSQRTAVRRLHAVLATDGDKFAIMESLTRTVCLESVLTTDEFKSIDLAQKLRFLYDLSETVHYLHSIGIVIKTLSTLNVFVRQKEGGSHGIRPVLAGLEHSRLLTETTVELSFDPRFEAPDFQLQSQYIHTTYSDVWGLAVLIRSVLTSERPFDMTETEAIKNKAALHAKLSDASSLWDSTYLARLPNMQAMLKRCFVSKGTTRPTAGAIAETVLMDFIDETSSAGLASLGSAMEQVESGMPEKSKQEALDKVKSARAAKLEKQQVSEANTLGQNDWDTIWRSPRVDADATCQYLLGAAVWWNAVDESVSDKLFHGDNVLLAKFALQHITAAEELGYSDVDIELYQIHGYLASKRKPQIIRE